ncbi:MAG: hypothetical protein DSM106950_07140 [Stigonema ocellatum SAG 48.90 = DSM 106950]|nr:hypothetical protein [Stigonema ocellatum SAG 48.90 = DSM 106950]
MLKLRKNYVKLKKHREWGVGSGEWGSVRGGEFVFLSFVAGGVPPVGCSQETQGVGSREWGVGSGEWGNGTVCFIHGGWRKPPVGCS